MYVTVCRCVRPTLACHGLPLSVLYRAFATTRKAKHCESPPKPAAWSSRRLRTAAAVQRQHGAHMCGDPRPRGGGQGALDARANTAAKDVFGRAPFVKIETALEGGGSGLRSRTPRTHPSPRRRPYGRTQGPGSRLGAGHRVGIQNPLAGRPPTADRRQANKDRRSNTFNSHR